MFEIQDTDWPAIRDDDSPSSSNARDDIRERIRGGEVVVLVDRAKDMRTHRIFVNEAGGFVEAPFFDASGADVSEE